MLEPKAGEELFVKTLYYAMGVNYGLREASTCISVLIAVDRCLCVVFPLRANTLMSTRTMGILLATIVIGMQLAFVTTPVKRYVFAVYDNTTGGTRWAVAPSAAWQKSEVLLGTRGLEGEEGLSGVPESGHVEARSRAFAGRFRRTSAWVK
ncbi:hypothetical protein C0Q70_10542 [Pomacea canaliculata]|uniref:Uncharacterized protein n=1 Tax=Pomacea canaliculata TaxID=400727 RepID=A0A2T7P3I4_POMCA|nr:hypothetical protein C0Q70_10542 [Pomacea canaliculata]